MRVNDELTAEHFSFFSDQGYLVVEGAIQENELPHVQEEFYRVEEATRDDWKRAVADNVAYRPYRMSETSHVVAPIATHGDVFLDLCCGTGDLALLAAKGGVVSRGLDFAAPMLREAARKNSYLRAVALWPSLPSYIG